ncbi:MAG: hypothetical protein ACE5FT_04605 [Candidatus Nanoarchaeia archaeon]
MRKIWLLLFVFVLLTTVVQADSLNTNKLNYFALADAPINRTLSYKYTGTNLANVTVVLGTPMGFVTVDTCGFPAPGSASCTCTSATQIAVCQNVSTDEVLLFNIEPQTFTQPEYAISISTGNSTDALGTNAIPTQNVSFIRIKEDEIFHTLIEFGRGRGNYFFDSLGRSSSAGDGTGAPYVPFNQKFELNYLHKIFNIKQYFGLATVDAENATWNCIYPNSTVVREHLVTDISRGANFNVDYKIVEIEGSFERQGYLGQQLDASEGVSVGNNFTINCTDMTFQLAPAGGNVSVPEDSFTLFFRSKEPFNVTASAGSTTIGNGTQLVDITYNIVNNEVYTADDVRVEIKAPQFAEFIGVKGELFGTARDKFLFERTRILGGATETITLTARFNTTPASGISSLNLSGVNVFEFIPPWEANAYNPRQLIQTLQTTDTVTVNLNLNSSVVNLLDIIDDINQTVNENNQLITEINNTINAINNTVNSVQSTVLEINTTVVTISENVIEINDTIQILFDLNETIVIINDTVNTINLTLSNLTINANISVNLTTVLDGITELNFTSAQLNQTVNNIIRTVDEINDTLGLDSVGASGTLFSPEDVIVVDALFRTNKGVPISGGSCNLTLMDSTFTLLIENATMTEQSVGGVPHYTFNTTNVSALGGASTGKFFGHVKCKDGNKPTIFAEADFEVRNSIATTDFSSVLTKLERIQEFDEELVFLVTDSFGLREEARQDAINGNTGDAIEKLAQANNQLSEAADRLASTRDQMLSSAATPPGSPSSASGASSSWGLEALGYTQLWAVILILFALLIYAFKREHVHEPEF